jgi:hypothetical protein
MPFIPSYYRNVASVFRKEAKLKIKKLLGIATPATKEAGYFEQTNPSRPQTSAERSNWT